MLLFRIALLKWFFLILKKGERLSWFNYYMLLYLKRGFPPPLHSQTAWHRSLLLGILPVAIQRIIHHARLGKLGFRDQVRSEIKCIFCI